MSERLGSSLILISQIPPRFDGVHDACSYVLKALSASKRAAHLQLFEHRATKKRGFSNLLSDSLICSSIARMPLEKDDQDKVDQAMEEVGSDTTGTRLAVVNAPQAQKLGFWTVLCTVLNRAIGVTYPIYLHLNLNVPLADHASQVLVSL